MTTYRALRFAVLLSLGLGGPMEFLAADEDRRSTDANAEEKGTTHSVDAGMGYPTDGGVGIQAEKQPGSFTIPKNSTGTKLQYEFFDPKSNRTLTKLNGRSIYSVTEHRYMDELDKDPDFALPPGDYKFVVGGSPGATGRLRYTTVPSPAPKPPPKGTTHSVDANMGYPTDGGVGIQAEKQPGSFTIPKNSTGTKLQYEFFDPKSNRTLTKLNGRSIYSVTEHRYMDELDKDPDFALPPGDYKFVVGGSPGATGRLRYTTVPSPETKPPTGPVRTVDASMGYPTDGGVGIQAEKQPGSFTIPAGRAGTKFKYEFFDPKSNRTLTKLNGRSIFSVTEHRYMDELDNNPDFELPPGDYKFVVGGQPGATGRFSFTEVPFSGKKSPPKPPGDKPKRRDHFVPPIDPIPRPDTLVVDPPNPTAGEPVDVKPDPESIEHPVPTSEPPQPPPPSVQRGNWCPHCNQYHNTSHTNDSSRTRGTSPPGSRTRSFPLPWTTWEPPPQTTKKPLPPSSTTVRKPPPQTTKKPPPPSSTTVRKPPPQTTKKLPPPSSTTKKSSPPQTTKKAGTPSLDKNNPNYIKNVLQNGAIQKRPDQPR